MECLITEFGREVSARLVNKVCRPLERGGPEAAKEAQRGVYEVLVWTLSCLDGDPALYKKGIPSKLRYRLHEAYGEDCSLDRIRWAMIGKAKWHELTPGAKFGMRSARVKQGPQQQQQQEPWEDNEEGEQEHEDEEVRGDFHGDHDPLSDLQPAYVVTGGMTITGSEQDTSSDARSSWEVRPRAAAPAMAQEAAAPFRVVPFRILSDNYSYLLINEESWTALAVVDPAEDAVVKAKVEMEGVKLVGVLTTHHHWDHAWGNNDLAKRVLEGLAKVGGLPRV